MSWLARSLSNSLAPDPPGGVTAAAATSSAKTQTDALESDGGSEEEDEDTGRGVKDDLSELSQTLARQFWGVASFLAPLPHSSGGDGARPPESPVHRDGELSSDSAGIAGIRSDFAEIGGKFRSSFSKISGNMGVPEISKIASNFLPYGAKEEVEADEEEEEVEVEDFDDYREFGACVIGITDEVMSFVHNISMHAETWLDFPLLSDDEDSDDFYLSDAQIEHAYTVERLSPRLAALRIELCPNHMSEGCFWKTYFVLLHPRLSKHDAELLSTPQVVEARALLLQKLQNQAKSDSSKLVDVSHKKLDERSLLPFKQVTISKDNFESPSENHYSANIGTENSAAQPMVNIDVVDKSVIFEEPPKAPLKELSVVPSNSVEKFDEDEDKWLEDDTEDIVCSGNITFPVDSEDVSFSDLEEEDERDAPKGPKG